MAASCCYLFFLSLSLLLHHGTPLAEDSKKPNGSIFWDVPSLAGVTNSLIDEVVQLRNELHWYRNKDIRQQNEEGHQRDMEAPPNPLREGASHPTTVFLTKCAGTNYFQLFCGPFFASFERAYGLAADDHKMAVFVSNVELPLLEYAAERFEPWIHFEELQEDDFEETGINTTEIYLEAAERGTDQVTCKNGSCNYSERGVNRRESATNDKALFFPLEVSKFLKDYGHMFRYAVIMDSDMLFVRPLGHFLGSSESYLPEDVPRPGNDWDVAITVYVPWSNDSAEVGMTKSGYARINSGVFLLSLQNVPNVRRFLHRLTQLSDALDLAHEHERNGRQSGDEFADSLQKALAPEFRRGDGSWGDQAALALLAASFDVGRIRELLAFRDCRICKEAEEANLALYDGEKPVPVRFRALPARMLNHPESMVEGRFPSDVMIVHLKGLWWRLAASKGILGTTASRRAAWNRDAYALFIVCKEVWQTSLPPLLRDPRRIPAFLRFRERLNLVEDQ